MKYGLLSIFLALSLYASGQELLLSGVYKGESIYIQNPYQIATNEFCVQSVKVNGKEQGLNLNLTAVRLNFKSIDRFSPVTVKIIHGDSCKPRIVNPEAILYHSNFKFDSLVLNDSIMHWYTKGDRRDGLFKIEQLKNLYWNEVKTVRSKGRFDGAQYVFFPDHQDGGNKYRIKYELPNNRYLYSPELEHYHYPDGVSFSPRLVTDKMNLSREARYEILKNGEVILSGVSKVIPLRRLSPGDYSIMLNGEEHPFVKK